MPIRWRSLATYLEQPLVCVVLGPDPAHNEMRGHARGIIDIGALSLGGLAVGYIGAGGSAVGYYALGSAAFGKFVWSGIHRDPQAVEFFSRLRSRLPHPARPEAAQIAIVPARCLERIGEGMLCPASPSASVLPAVSLAIILGQPSHGLRRMCGWPCILAFRNQHDL